MNAPRLIRKDLLHLLCDFLETWIHQILYHRHIYPQKIFEQRTKFQVPVYIAMHPDVQQYISQFSQSFYTLLEKNGIKYVNLTVKNEQKYVEKFVFEIRSVLNQLNIPFDKVYESESSFTLADVEIHLKACLLKLKTLSLMHKPLEGSTFFLSIETLEGGYPLLAKGESSTMDWVPSDIDADYKHIIPIKSASIDLFKFNTFIMEASKKGKERE